MKSPHKIITLITDFGWKDSYVAEMKGAILKQLPMVRIVDISHEVTPQNILEAGLFLWRSYRYFPKGTVHVVVVDPGVGTSRKLLIAKTSTYFFLAPDNGILSPILSENEKTSFYEITPRRLFVSTPSHTFHGRDILTPCAVFLSKGVSPRKLGIPISAGRITPLPQWRPSLGVSRMTGCILSSDHFGNLVTNIHEKDYLHFKRKGRGKKVWIRSGRCTIKKLSKTYAGGKGGPLALFGSSSLLELSVRNGNASKALALRAGDRVQLIYGTD